MTSFPASVYANRLTRAQQLGTAAGTPLVITPGPDLAYLTGIVSESFERLTALVITADGFALVLPRLELAILTESAVPGLADAGVELTVTDWVDGADPYALVVDRFAGAERIAVGDAVPALHLVPLLERGVSAELATGVLRRLRMIKDRAEIDELRAAGAAIDRVHARVPDILKVGRTEREVADDIAAAIVEEGHTVAAFVIVGSGPHGADPHHEVSDRVIEAGDVVVVDIGGPLPSGYNSDSTRTYSMGEPAADIAQQYAVLERAQAASVAAVRPGVSAESIDAAGRALLTDAGLGEYFVHRTGHGIGLSVHEEPYVVAGNELPVEPGMAFSIEPGIYFRGSWGARIEDIVIVTEDGCEPVNTRPHGLTVL
ncbi:Peptidase M24 OS=Tsukamurella paurometabola (strain ATCC 8368 / DSM / CCUG 35730 / CIP 100753/ JCM 10117 / KCTC 9821 / NBRC 16120 / NCIMB 702349 / NCTC 13040) OX=521096 GN=Tpau_2174 PE=3 SV=1 [Tsukamurella paurometabola]|uniref:Peptidase M24 n=1 Tax=Tsukamurella paurometabola (strain ATCC 8368 / DSM 20162 / CCUG 35730 / CIP 100753 / JCM 10117 / KCTC 9821 / NBRC 16120 / NCIMB 702349 / NCTC 13040) TaxID=521096 RepID=D5UPM8_TSUPD|nr:Xaa-Pro peptidase family protein [Tsukamurella paurometabola]ADG78784.1 peptidase M24 [Tsukamurella paurometabola DSM 20162]SUP33142.1 Xaa-Pro dipeptidase [Tsukamurella paurometabola]